MPGILNPIPGIVSDIDVLSHSALRGWVFVCALSANTRRSPKFRDGARGG
jgi:hypothetical protein